MKMLKIYYLFYVMNYYVVLIFVIYHIFINRMFIKK